MSRLRALLAITLWGSGIPVSAQSHPDFGRLFTTPEERARIDSVGSTLDPAPTEASSGPVRLDGIIRRNDGRAVVWVDGRAAGAASARAATDGRHAVVVLPNGERRELLVGESVLPEDGSP